MKGRGGIGTGAGAALAILALAGCARNHAPSMAPGGSGSAHNGAGRAAGGAGRAASEADPPDTGEPFIADAPRAFAVGKVQPLGEPLSFAFKAGYHAQEQIWLRGVDGALARVSSWDGDPRYAASCGEPWSTGGYFGGRFGPLQLDPEGSHLLFAEFERCGSDLEEFPSRVVAHELASGRTRVLLEASGRPEIVVGAGTAIVIVRRVGQTYPPEQVPPGGLELYEFTGDALEPIAVPRAADWLRVYGEGYLVPWNGRVLLFVDGVPALERVDGRWQRSELGAQLAGSDLRALAAAPSQTRLCAVTSRIKPEGGREDSIGWVLESDGSWVSAQALPNAPFSCLFAPDDGKVAFGTSFYALQDAQLSPVTFASERVRGLYGTWRGALYGTDADSRGVARMDWSTLAIETALAGDDLPELCATPSSRGGAPSLYLPPDDRPLALMKVGCGCIDCDVSSSLAWHSESGSVATIEDVWGEHDVYGYAWLADGGAVLLSTQTEHQEDGGKLRHPQQGQYYLVSAEGAVETLGPLAGVDGVLHSPVAGIGR